MKTSSLRRMSLVVLLLWPFWVSAAEPPPALSVYGSLPTYEDVALAPSGERYAMVVTVGEKRLLLAMDKNHKPEIRMELGDRKVRSIAWADDHHLLIRITNTANLGIGFTAEKTELGTYVVVDVDRRTLFHVFERQPSITGGVRRFYGVASRDGHLYGYFSGITLQTNRGGDFYLETTHADLYEVDLDNGDARRIAENPRTDTAREWVMDATGHIAAYMDFNSLRGDWRILNAQKHEVAKGMHPFGSVGLAGLGRHPETLLYTQENVETGERQWFELPMSGGEARQLFADVRIDDIVHDRLTHELIGYSTGGEQHFSNGYFDRVTRSLDRVFAGLRVEVEGWNDAFERLLVRTNGTGDPGRWWLVDINTGKADLLGVSYPVPASQIATTSVFNYNATDGLELDGILTVPPGKEAHNMPLVVMPHGGPSSHDTTDFDWMAQAFAVRGYVVFQPNFRGSTNRGADFEKAGNGQWGLKMQTDISDGVVELARQGIIDPRRVCIVGASYGGYAALAGVTLQQGIYRCAVSYAGISDLKAHRHERISRSGGNPIEVRVLNEMLGPEKNMEAVSPLNRVADVSVPVLLMHGKNDTVVLFEQSQMMERALRKAGKPVELVTLDGEDHWLSRSKTRMQMLEAAVTFVEKHNPH